MLIARLGVVDREYFEALTGERFASDREAIRHYLAYESDAALALSLSPLIEAGWQSHQLHGTDASWYAVLAREKGLWAPSPVFDSRVYDEREGDLGPRLHGSTRRALKRFTRSAAPETPMPMSPESRGVPLTWAETRRRAIEGAQEYRAQLHLRRARTSEVWDAHVEARFVAAALAGRRREKSRVSIIMPTRDRAGRLDDAIRSVRAQSHVDWELIVVDDGSTDGTDDLLRRLSEEDDRIRVITQEAKGVSAARNAGLSAATGDVVAFLDSDNTWRSRFLELSLAGMTMVGTEAVYSAVVLHRDEGEVRYRGIQATRDDLLYAGNVVDLNSLVLSRRLMETTGGFDEAVRRWVDYDLLLTLTETVVPTYLPFLGVDYDDRSSPDRVTGSELASWEDAVLGKHLIDWGALGRSAGDRERGSASVVVPTYGDWILTAAAVRAVLDHSGASLEEVIVIDNGSRRHVSAILRGLFGGDPRVRVVRMARNLNFALANNYAVSLSRGEFIVTLNNDTQVTKGWLDPLLAPLADESAIGTQPLLLYPDGTVQTAGTVFLTGEPFPSHFLAHHPVEEALRVSDDVYSAVTAAAMAMRASDLIRLRGFDPLFMNGLEDVDLCLRALALGQGRFRVVTGSVVFHHEGQTPGRARAVGRNRNLFLERWGGTLPSPDDWRSDALGAP